MSHVKTTWGMWFTYSTLMASVIGHPWVSAGFSYHDAQHWGFG